MRGCDELIGNMTPSAQTRILIGKLEGVMDVERENWESVSTVILTPNAFVSAIILECPSLRVVTVLMS